MDEENKNSDQPSDQNYQNETSTTVKNEVQKNFGLTNGLIFTVIGFLLVAFNLNSINNEGKYYIKLFGVGMALLYCGIAFLMFPGAKEFEIDDPKRKLSSHIAASKPWELIIWLLYFIAGIVLAIIIGAVSETWEQIWTIFLISGIVSGIIFFIKNIVLLAVNFKKSSENPDYIRGEESSTGTSGFDYYNPSKLVCLLGIIIGLSVAGGCSYKLFSISDSIQKPSSQDIDDLVSLIDESVPVYFLGINNSNYALIECDPSEDDYVNLVRIPMKDLILNVIRSDLYNKNFSTNYGVQGIFLNGDDHYAQFDAKRLKSIPEVKELRNDNSYQSVIDLTIKDFADTADKFFTAHDTEDEYVVITVYSYDNEFMLMWGIDEFVDFFNSSNRELLKDEEPYTKEEILYSFVKGSFDDTTYRLLSLKDFLEDYTDLEYKPRGILFNLGTKECSKAYSWEIDNYCKKNIKTSESEADEE